MRQQSGQQYVFLGIVTVVAIIFLARIFYIQVIEDRYKLSANNNVLRTITDYPARGFLYDRKGRLLVYNEAVYDLMVTPRQVKDLDTASFCGLLGITREEFLKKMEKAKKYSRVKASVFEKQVSASMYAVLQERLYKFKGFFVQPRTVRRYPEQVSAHTLGYIGEASEKLLQTDPYYKSGDYVGISGLEKSYEEELRGRRGVRVVMVDVHNREKGSFADGQYDTLPVAGKNLEVTLDLELQRLGEKLLKNKIGSIVAIEPQTGEILALVTNPTYDPNLMVGRERSKHYGKMLKDPTKPLFNRATQAYYPPGSTFKLVNALIAMQEGMVNQGTTYPHSFVVGSKSVKCHPHPDVALVGAIQYSCNPYFCNSFRSVVDGRKFSNSEAGYRRWREHVLAFGIGRKIGVDLPAELPGLVPAVELYDKYYGKGRWRASTIYSLGIGQGELGTTPLQMANIICAIANKGYYYIPHMVRKIGGKPNRTRGLYEKQFTLIDPKHFEVVHEGMQLVVEAGTAKIAKFGDVAICGKTGTAQNPHGKDHSLFVAFAPRENPKIAIAIMVENAGWGGEWAAPMGSLMIEQYLNDSIARTDLLERMVESNLMPGAPEQSKTKKDSIPD
ncbi:MAG: penicillin-binding protein 2 [Bacteroidota bacterium]